MKAVRLRTEYLFNPLGIDIEHPRLFWNCEGGITQSAYRLVCWKNGVVILDTGKVYSSSMEAVYPGEPVSRERITFCLKLWDEEGVEGPWSEEAFFEMGLLSLSDWQAKWICGNYTVRKDRRYPADYFRKRFTVGKVGTARLYITACGLYEATINGRRVGDFVMAPGHTDYRKRISYQTYDVTDLLREGENVLKITLADGWYRGSCGAWGRKNQYGTVTKVLAQLEADGSVLAVTDATWQWSNDGPVRFADNKDGEIVDGRLSPSYAGKAQITEHPVIPTASDNVPVTEHETFTPSVTTTPTGKTVFDFSQNMAGFIAFSLSAHDGQKVTLRFGEMLDADGEFTQKNIQCSNKKITTPLQKVEYVCHEGRNDYKTRFAVFGFRYALLETDVDWKAEDFKAVAVYSDLEQTGFFECSNDLLNRFVENTLWSAKSNFLDIPTDCPTRERHGWTGDAQIFFDTASYLFDYAAFSRKYLHDIYDWQKENGNLPQIAPEGGTDFYMAPLNGSSGWSDIGILLPYRFWKKYGDEELLRTFYPGMKKYAEFLKKRCGKHTLLSRPLGLHGKDRKYAVNCGQSYGEWAEPADVYPMHWTDMVLPHPEVSTAYTAYCFSLMEEAAQAMGDTEGIQQYASLAENVRASYQTLRKKPVYTLDTDRQAMLVRPLALHLLDKEQETFAKERLIQALDSYGWRIGTGFLSTPLILRVLADIDPEYACRLLENEEMPGWLFMPKSGATTVWESWEGTDAQGGIASLNHYSKGAVCQWLFEGLCGIHVDGKAHFRIAPQPGGHFTRASAKYRSLWGEVESGWKRTEKETTYRIVVPSGCGAEVFLPDGREANLTAGTHVFRAEP